MQRSDSAMADRVVRPEPWEAQGVVLVVLDLTMALNTAPLRWALESVVRKGDILRVVGVLTHILNPLGYKCRLNDNSWTGANRKILEAEIANKRYMLHNVKELHAWCEKAEVQLIIEVCAGLHLKKIVVEEARSAGAYHVVLDKTMNKERKFYVDNLTCFVTRMRASGGVDSVRSFALSSQQPSAAPTPCNTQSETSAMSSKTSGASSTDCNDRIATQNSSIAASSSSGTSSSSLSFDALSCDDLFSINHESASERNLFEPLATMVEPNDAALKLGSSSRRGRHPKSVDDTPKSSRASSPRRSKRKQQLLPTITHSPHAQSAVAPPSTLLDSSSLELNDSGDPTLNQERI